MFLALGCTVRIYVFTCLPWKNRNLEFDHKYIGEIDRETS